MKTQPICSRCHVEHARFRDAAKTKPASYCKDCHASMARETRVPYRLLKPEAKKKALARAYVHTYVKRGRLVKEPCMLCKNPNSEAHHDDYDRPLDVHWLCRLCHMRVHETDRLIEANIIG